MVFDTLDNASTYAALSPRIARALEFLKQPQFVDLEPGRHPIEGDDLFALVQRYRPKPRSEGFWEAHRRYIDVQYVAAGAELMGRASLAGLTVSRPYDAEKDLLVLDGASSAGQFFTVPAGSFTIFWPHDAHMPGLAPPEPSVAGVTKVVIKVRVEGR